MGVVLAGSPQGREAGVGGGIVLKEGFMQGTREGGGSSELVSSV